MAYELRELSGSAFLNTDKIDQKQPSWCDFQGRALIDGQTYFVSIWKKKTKAGETWLSLNFKAAGGSKKAEPRRGVQTSAPANDDPFGDSIPF